MKEHTVTEQEQGVDAAAGAGEGTGEDALEADGRIEAEVEEGSAEELDLVVAAMGRENAARRGWSVGRWIRARKERKERAHGKRLEAARIVAEMEVLELDGRLAMLRAEMLELADEMKALWLEKRDASSKARYSGMVVDPEAAVRVSELDWHLAAAQRLWMDADREGQKLVALRQAAQGRVVELEMKRKAKER